MAKIAVVEDNDAMRAQLCGFIAQYAQESGHQLDVTAFSDGAQLVEPYRPGFDIIFLDIEMPKLGGMPTAERIRRQDPDVVLVFVTNMAQYAIRGYEVDALDFVLKPVSYYQFSTKLERALQRIQRRRGQRARDIRAAARERAELAVRHQAIEARNDDALVPGQRAQRGIGFLLIDGAVIVEKQPLRGVHERKAEVIGHKQRGKVLAARDELIAGNALLHLTAQTVEHALEIDPQAKLAVNVAVALANHLINAVARHAVLQVRIAQIQQIGDLIVARAALARRRNCLLYTSDAADD